MQARVLSVAHPPRLARLDAALRGAGFAVAEATSGREALRAARTCNPDLALIDTRLPDVDAFEVCRRIKRDPRTASVLVVLVGPAADAPAVRTESAESKPDALVTDSGDPGEAVALIRALVGAQHLPETQPNSGARSDLVESLPATVFEMAPDGTLTFVNQAGLRFMGYGPDDVARGLSWFQFIVPAQRDEARASVQGAVAGDTLIRQYLVQCKDGRTIPVEIHLSPGPGRGQPGRLAGILVDISERERAEAALARSEERYRLLFNSINDAVLVYDGADDPGRLIEVNDIACRQLGYSREELLQMRVSDVDAPDSAGNGPSIIERLRAGRHAVWEGTHLARDGRRIPVEITAHLLDLDGRLTILSTARDITERKRIEEALRASEAQLRQAQKMEAIGQLAGGIAHDFNNLLTAILGYSDLALATLAADDPLRADLEEIRRAGESATSLTRQLLAFSRRQVLQPVLVDLNAIVRGVDRMLRRVIGEDIDLQVVPGPDLNHVHADPGQIEQVLMNLAVNARHAMPQGGKLTIETSNIDLDEAYARAHLPVTPGRYVMLVVSDTGVGMTPEVQRRIFEPFFTTKELGQGTGLGLSTVYGIVKQSGGYIWVDSAPGRGSTFKIYLPRAEHESAGAVEPRRDSVVATAGTETILLVEDDERVRHLAERALARYGYVVLGARNADEAMAFVRDHGGPIHVLLTDLVMPGSNGLALAEDALRIRPQTKVLYTSGYADHAIIDRGVLDAGAAYLQKPYTPETLASKVRQVLDERVD